LCKLVVVKRKNIDSRIQKDVSAKFIDMKLVLTSSTELRSKPNVKYLTPAVANYIATHDLYLEEQIKPLMSAKRYAHTLRVNKLAMELATCINKELVLPAHIAAMCHDIGKELGDKQVLKLVGKYDHK
jgi:HD-GYP domain-containing protein (c-di-GMP phosphodiesterase class II)